MEHATAYLAEQYKTPAKSWEHDASTTTRHDTDHLDLDAEDLIDHAAELAILLALATFVLVPLLLLGLAVAVSTCRGAVRRCCAKRRQPPRPQTASSHQLSDSTVVVIPAATARPLQAPDAPPPAAADAQLAPQHSDWGEPPAYNDLCPPSTIHGVQLRENVVFGIPLGEPVVGGKAPTAASPISGGAP